MILLFILTGVLGIFVGFVLHSFFTHKNPVGTLRIDNSDPDDGPYLFLELEADPSILNHNDYIMLKVDRTNYISQQ